MSKVSEKEAKTNKNRFKNEKVKNTTKDTKKKDNQPKSGKSKGAPKAANKKHTQKSTNKSYSKKSAPKKNTQKTKLFPLNIIPLGGIDEIGKNITAYEYGEDIIFLRQILPGASDRSYGIHVAKLAGVPAPVLERAKVILELLEQTPGTPQEAISSLPRRTVKGKRKPDEADDAVQLRLL